jgi:hypothetical protein
MTVINREAPPPLREETLDRYRGKWIALRHGEVIASADTLRELASDDRVEPLDPVYRVPPVATYFY